MGPMNTHLLYLERDVSASRSEYLHGLRLAFPAGVEETGQEILVTDGRATLEITLIEQAPRVIALLRLPRMKVVLRFTQGTPDQQAALLAYMDLAMQRGGG